MVMEAPVTPHKRYEQTVRAYTAFFSAFMGFGLKAVIDHKEWGHERWVCFAITLPLFLRYLLGSSNQLWYEYVREDPSARLRSLILWDFCWLLTFGILGMVICYTNSVQGFLRGTAVFGLVATLGPLWDKWIKDRKGIQMNEFWFEWFRINAIFTFVALVTAIVYRNGFGKLQSVYGVDWSLIVLALASIAIMFFDLRHQLHVLEPAETDRPDD